jgi:hypothetical protein
MMIALWVGVCVVGVSVAITAAAAAAAAAAACGAGLFDLLFTLVKNNNGSLVTVCVG